MDMPLPPEKLKVGTFVFNQNREPYAIGTYYDTGEYALYYLRICKIGNNKVFIDPRIENVTLTTLNTSGYSIYTDIFHVE